MSVLVRFGIHCLCAGDLKPWRTKTQLSSVLKFKGIAFQQMQTQKFNYTIYAPSKMKITIHLRHLHLSALNWYTTAKLHCSSVDANQCSQFVSRHRQLNSLAINLLFDLGLKLLNFVVYSEGSYFQIHGVTLKLKFSMADYSSLIIRRGQTLGQRFDNELIVFMINPNWRY